MNDGETIHIYRPFQSTLPRGERRNVVGISRSCGNFNPRSREGSDGCYIFSSFQSETFQSTLPRGERLEGAIRGALRGLFQSTLPRGERLRRIRVVRQHRDFNPRSREGSDGGCDPRCTARIISIHAPREGSDIQILDVVIKALISIHAPREGSDNFCGRIHDDFSISIHAPREGSDWIAVIRMRIRKNFNPRPPRGERLVIRVVIAQL
ncbi:Protein of uncharacterised function (DUF3264) [uncultured Clostridium sp.]|nr:Protein of uncharacterised function (DUF3264) [uncultured Clostridium sp.]